MGWTLLIIPLLMLIRVAFEFRKLTLAGRKKAAYLGLPLQVLITLGGLLCAIGLFGVGNASDATQAGSFKMLAVIGGVPAALAAIIYLLNLKSLLAEKEACAPAIASPSRNEGSQMQ